MPLDALHKHVRSSAPVIVPWFTGTGEGTEVEGGWGSGRTLSPFPVFSPLLGLPVRVEAGG